MRNSQHQRKKIWHNRDQAESERTVDDGDDQEDNDGGDTQALCKVQHNLIEVTTTYHRFSNEFNFEAWIVGRNFGKLVFKIPKYRFVFGNPVISNSKTNQGFPTGSIDKQTFERRRQ